MLKAPCDELDTQHGSLLMTRWGVLSHGRMQRSIVEQLDSHHWREKSFAYVKQQRLLSYHWALGLTNTLNISLQRHPQSSYKT